MKEYVLFKNTGEFPAESRKTGFSTGEGENRFFYHEVRDAGLLHEIDLRAGPSSSLEVVLFQDVPANGKVWIRLNTRMEADSRLRLVVVQNGGEAGQVDVNSVFLGRGSRIEIRGLQNAREKQRLSIRVDVGHGIPQTSSDLQVWCAARDESRSVFNGSVRIEKGAHHTEAFQKNRNLILSPRAVVDSFPKLFIENDNVKCSHGSSTSTLEPDQAYYLQSRGIGAEDAEEMLIQGFLRQAISGIGNEECRKALSSRLGLEEGDWV
jgi:Fe-S cluster assembly protein SufD